jgi:transmembrane sensor
VETERVRTREELEQAAATWIARREGGAWTEADATSLAAWLAQSAGHRVAYYRLNAAWTEAGRVRAVEAATPAAGTALPTAAPVLPKSRPRFAAFAIAATVLILLSAGLVAFKDELFRTQQHFTTAIGGLQTIPLSDGSRVLLNTDSKIRVSLTSRERRVEIDRGEAFFDVAHDASRPFVVQAGERRVIAVGTQFSVRRQERDLHVTVAEGTVRLESNARDTLLPAGSIVQARGDNVHVEQRPLTDVERQLTWRSGVLTFRDTALAEAVAEFNRYNTRKLIVGDPRIATLQVSGVFRSNSVDSFVRLLERGFAVQAAAQPDRIVLTPSTGRDGRSP